MVRINVQLIIGGYFMKCSMGAIGRILFMFVIMLLFPTFFKAVQLCRGLS